MIKQDTIEETILETKQIAIKWFDKCMKARAEREYYKKLYTLYAIGFFINTMLFAIYVMIQVVK